MTNQPFYDPTKSYQENFDQGPFGDFATARVYGNEGQPVHEFLEQSVYAPFGIAAGPLLNSKFVIAALDMGFDIPVYKTVRSGVYPCHPWPNVLPVDVTGDLEPDMKELVATSNYEEPLSITNSFGVPSFDPDFWQEDMAKAVRHAKVGQVVVGSFQGTNAGDGNVEKYIADFVTTAKLVKQTGIKVAEVNLSCPNEGTAHLLCYDIERTKQIVEAIKNEIGNMPLVIKVAYFKSNDELAKLVDSVGGMVQGIAAINTIAAKIVTATGQQALPGEGRLVSGVCGSSIKWAGLDQVKRLAELREQKNMQFKIIGVGGVANSLDYAAYRDRGADAVMSATGAMWNPYLAQEIKENNF